MSDQGTPANWYPDPSGRHELRWFDGAQWTDQVSTGGRVSTDQQPGTSMPSVDRDPARTQRDVARAGIAPGAAPMGGGTIFTEPVLVVSQKAKLIELSNEYGVFDQRGAQLAVVREVGQSKARKAVRLLTNYDQFLTHRLQVCDPGGAVLLQLTRPAKLVKSKVVVQDGQGRDLGTVVQENAIGKIRFGIMVGDQKVGSINGENWRAWNFNIQDAGGGEIARITKTWEGLARTMFTTADNYVVQIHRPMDEPLRSLVVASALCVDTALKQDSRGLG